jgi:hypothetical protein
MPVCFIVALHTWLRRSGLRAHLAYAGILLVVLICRSGGKRGEGEFQLDVPVNDFSSLSYVIHVRMSSCRTVSVASQEQSRVPRWCEV